MIFRSVAEVKSRDSNEQIGEWNDAADFPGFRIDLSGKLSHLLRKRLKRKDRKSTRLNSSHSQISYAVFCLKKKKWYDLHLRITLLRHACVQLSSTILCSWLPSVHMHFLFVPRGLSGARSRREREHHHMSND